MIRHTSRAIAASEAVIFVPDHLGSRTSVIVIEGTKEALNVLRVGTASQWDGYNNLGSDFPRSYRATRDCSVICFVITRALILFLL